jgi:hypothetical protein
MPQLSERKIAIRLLDDLIPKLRSQTITASTSASIRKRLLWLFFFDELLNGDPMVIQMYRLAQRGRTQRASLLRGMIKLRSRIESLRYFLDRGSWRGLRQGRRNHLDWLMYRMDDVWFRSPVRYHPINVG